MNTVLLVDDDITFTKIISTFLKKKGFSIDIAHTVHQGIGRLNEQAYDLLLLDYRLPDGTGLDVLAAIHEMRRKMPAIMMTSFDDVRTAVKAMRSGAFDYITKPVNHEELMLVIWSALEKPKDTATVPPAATSPSYLEGISPAARKLHEQLSLVAPTPMTVIIQGESGTGKEYVARSIHALSPRAHKPFVAIDCGALSKELAASELFGHVKGAFTGALHNKPGKFEAAHGGTLFLDEAGNLSYDVQVKLLRALQEKVIQPVGNNREISTDVRIIVATNEDLVTGVQQGHFREDLYHRLNEFKLQVPALREREGDLPLFIDHFIRESNVLLGRNVKSLSPAVTELLHHYDWPGNLRELKNVVKRLVLLSAGDRAEKEALPDDMLAQLSRHPTVLPEGTDLKAWQEKKEKELIEKALINVKYNKARAARLLNIDRSTLYAKMEKYNIKG